MLCQIIGLPALSHRNKWKVLVTLDGCLDALVFEVTAPWPPLARPIGDLAVGADDFAGDFFFILPNVFETGALMETARSCR